MFSVTKRLVNLTSNLSNSITIQLFLLDKDSSQVNDILSRLQKQPPEVFYEKDVLKTFAKFTGKHLCQSLFFNKVAGLRPSTLLKKTLSQVLSCEFCEIFKNTFFTDPGDCF